MKLTRPVTAPERDAAAGPAPVLHWVPGYVTSSGCGSRELQDAAAYEAGEPGGRDPEYDIPRDTPAGDLAAWAARQLGYPVDLEAATCTILAASLRPVSIHAGHEPACYVCSAAGEGNPA
jgi:hypothetical protein